MKTDEISLRRFGWLLSQRGFNALREEEIAQAVALRETQLDYYVQTGRGLAFLVEVEAFEQEGPLRSTLPSVFTLDHMATQKRINRAVRRAADQLAPYAPLGIPLVVALDNHRQVGLIIDQHALLSLFGEPQTVLSIDPATGEAVRRTTQHRNDNSPLAAGERPFVSAVVLVSPEYRTDDWDAPDDFTVERPMKAHVIHHPAASVALPAWVFAGPLDLRLAFDGTRWVETQGTASAG
jgi:hypothetical protein